MHFVCSNIFDIKWWTSVIDIIVFDVYFPAFLDKFFPINSFMTEAVIT